MATLFRWLFRLVSALLVLSLMVVGTVYWLAGRSLPDYEARHQVTGLAAPVEIVRNNANVPHIFGASDGDVFYGLGFVHAQDRMWQMVTLRRTAQGKLSEVFGARTVQIDEVMRRLDVYGRARDSVAALTPETRAALEAYSAGVNAWIAQVNAEAKGRGAPEFFLFPQQIAPWTPADSVAVVKLMAIQLSDHLEDEVLRAQVSLLLPEARLADILPDVPGSAVAALPEYAALLHEGAPGLPSGTSRPVTQLASTPNTPNTLHGPLSPFPARGRAGASNAWAAAPARSASGGALLANDPHLDLSAPAIWYLARLELQGGGVIGGTLPGIPAVVVGRAEGFGWGFTAAYVDDVDIIIEKIDPANPEAVMREDGPRPFATRQSIITIKDAAPVTITLRESDAGPILPGSAFNLAAVTPPGHVAAIQWTMLSREDTSLDAIMALMRARSIPEGLAAGAAHVAPGLNVTMTDGTDVALKTFGQIPARDPAHQSLGRIPAPGWRAANLWTGVQPYDANPAYVAPVGGILGNTNNKVIDRPFPDHVSFHWGDTQRVQRWRRLMQGREVHTRESFTETQLDAVSFAARALLPLVAGELWFTGEAAPEGSPERQRQRALAMLSEWNGEMNEHLPEPLIYAAWMRALQDRLIRDELGPVAGKFTRIEPIFIERVYRDIDGAAAWCDVIQSAATESCTDVARLALDDALVWISETYGASLESLRWGDAHEARHDHQVLGEVPVLRWFVNIRQSTSGGDFTLQRGTTLGEEAAPFANVHAAAYRGVYDFADPDSSIFIISTGQSGHFLSRHYDDLGEFWRRGEYVPMSLDPELARAGSVGVTLLEPKGWVAPADEAETASEEAGQ